MDLTFKRLDSYYDLERSIIFEEDTPLSLKGILPNETKIILEHIKPNTENKLYVRFIFRQASLDGKTYLSRFFESLYQLYFQVDLSTKSETEFLKIIPIVYDLNNLFNNERDRLATKYKIFDLTSLSAETLARVIINDFYLSSGISH